LFQERQIIIAYRLSLIAYRLSLIAYRLSLIKNKKGQYLSISL